MNEAEARRRFTRARVARLATVRPDGGPHAVPIVFALEADTIYSAIDAKPKRSAALARLENIRTEPRAAVLVDAYDEDWGALWWVRADGEAHVTRRDWERDRGLALLAAKYRHYATDPPPGPVIAIEVRAWRAWAASPPAG